jgi:transposase
MTLVGCDLHSRKQQVAVLDTDTGEVLEQALLHEGDAVERFYGALPRPVTVGIEATGYALWFHALMQKLGHTLLVGEAAKIRAMVVRKTKTDRRDTQHLLDLLKHDRFPTVWMPDPATRDLRGLIAHRAVRPHAHDGQEWPARDRPQPAHRARPVAVDQAGPRPVAGARPAAAHGPAPR